MSPTIERRPVIFMRPRRTGPGNVFELVLEDIATRETFSPALLQILGLLDATSVADPDRAGSLVLGKRVTVINHAGGNWAEYAVIPEIALAKVSPEWQSQVGKGTSVKWPTGIGGKGNEGVAGSIRTLPGSIGYVELVYAVQNNIAYGSIRNSAGVFLKASLEGVTAAAASVASMPADFRVSITNAPGKDAYPISSFTWLLIPAQSKDPAKGKILADFLNWMVTDGQKMAAPLSYAPLPDSIAEKVKEEIKQVR